MSTDFSSDDWFIAATIRKGIGRCYLVSAATLSEVEADNEYNAASSYEAARRWATKYVQSQEPAARIAWDTSRSTHFGYVSRKHVEAGG